MPVIFFVCEIEVTSKFTVEILFTADNYWEDNKNFFLQLNYHFFAHS